MIRINKSENINKSLVIGFFEGNQITKKYLTKLGDFSNLVLSKYGSIVVIPTYKKLDYEELVYVGLGKKEEININRLNKAFAKVFKTHHSVDIVIDNVVTKKTNVFDVAYNIAVTFTLVNYQFKKYGNNYQEEDASLNLQSKNDISEAVTKGIIVGDAINNARTLGNTPSNLMNPLDFVEITKEIAKEANLDLDVLDMKQLTEIKAGGILAVNKGSDIEPRMVILKHLPNPNQETLAFVGKGITFDSGGYNLKPGASMTGMKFDMCGGANVLSVMEIIGKLNINMNAIGIIPLTENMINGHGLKCDDVITMLSGKTVEVTNTDAEGRLILADGLTYAQNLGATYLIDMATLTGACVAALGDKYTGVFANDEEFYEILRKSSNETNELIWRLPIDEDYTNKMKKSDVADLVNSVKTSAGASLAAGFLGEFVNEGNKWIHLDIAGTSDSPSPNEFGPAGATGVMIKTLVELTKKLGNNYEK